MAMDRADNYSDAGAPRLLHKQPQDAVSQAPH
jgi:hypothetical protein